MPDGRTSRPAGLFRPENDRAAASRLAGVLSLLWKFLICQIDFFDIYPRVICPTPGGSRPTTPPRAAHEPSLWDKLPDFFVSKPSGCSNLGRRPLTPEPEGLMELRRILGYLPDYIDITD